jgi:hypothetical protein
MGDEKGGDDVMKAWPNNLNIMNQYYNKSCLMQVGHIQMHVVYTVNI